MIKADQAHKITDGNRNVARRRPRQRHRPRPPGPRRQHRRRRLGQLHRRRPAGHAPPPAGTPPPATTAPTSPAPSPPPATASASSASRPNVRMASVKVVNDAGFIYPEYAVCGFVWAGLHAHGRDQQQLLRRPVRCSTARTSPTSTPPRRPCAAPSTGRPTRASCTPPPPATRRTTSPNKSPSRTPRSPDDSRRRSTRTLNSGCEDIPTELDGVVPCRRCSASRRARMESRLSSFSNRGLGVDRRRRARLDDPVDDRRQQRLRHQERHVDGVAARRRRARPDEVGAPDLDAGADGREAARAGRRQGLRHHDRPARPASARPRTTATSVRASSTPRRGELTHTAPGEAASPPGGAASVRPEAGRGAVESATDAAPRLPLTPILTHQIRTDDP